MKYNYVVFGSDWELYRIAYSDLNKVDYAKYLWKRIDTDSWFLTNLYRIHTSPKTNYIVRLPFQGIWDSWQFRGSFKNENPICFIFFSDKNKILNKRFCGKLRERYKGCKLVLYCQDLIARSLKDRFIELRKEFDMTLSFDPGDAEAYGMGYYPLVYSPYDIPANTKMQKTDVYFLGAAKNRLNDIINAYEKLVQAGLHCDFYIAGVARKDQKYPKAIHYIKSMSYVENLQHVAATEYLLEIMQMGGRGSTMRYCEAIMYGKRMITNNPEIRKAPFYSSDKILCFDNIDELDVGFAANNKGPVNYNYKEAISPINLLVYIDKRL